MYYNFAKFFFNEVKAKTFVKVQVNFLAWIYCIYRRVSTLSVIDK